MVIYCLTSGDGMNGNYKACIIHTIHIMHDWNFQQMTQTFQNIHNTTSLWEVYYATPKTTA